jgi:hypothetical protein
MDKPFSYYASLDGPHLDGLIWPRRFIEIRLPFQGDFDRVLLLGRGQTPSGPARGEDGIVQLRILHRLIPRRRPPRGAFR